MKPVTSVLGVAAVVASTLALTSPTASAAQPSREPFNGTDSFTDASLCGFAIDVTSVVTGRATIWPQGEGAEHIVIHRTETDTFTANGVTLVGDPYTFKTTLQFTDFELVSYVAVGVLEKVRLPDGKTFMAAGQVDLLASTEDFVIVPDHGVSKNQDAFCGAMSA